MVETLTANADSKLESFAPEPVLYRSDSLRVTFGYDGNFHHSSGVTNYIKTVGDYLTSQGHEVSYLVAESQISDPRVRVIARTIPVPTNGSIDGVALSASEKHVAETVDELNPDVFHSQLPFNPLSSGKAFKYLNPEGALIGTFHSLPSTRLAKLGTWGIAQLVKRRITEFDELFAASEPLSEHSKKTFGTDTTRLALPIDIKALENSQRIDQYDDGKLNILFLGRLEPRKGCQHLLGAISLMSADIRNQIRVIVAGDGPLRNELEDFSNKNNLDETVEFLGDIAYEDKPDLLATSDIAAFPATGGESFGLVLAEAMAATNGIVVGGNNPGYRTVLKDSGETLFNPASHYTTADFLKNLILNDGLRAKIREDQSRLVQDYDVSVIGPVIEQAYFNALNAKAK